VIRVDYYKLESAVSFFVVFTGLKKYMYVYRYELLRIFILAAPYKNTDWLIWDVNERLIDWLIDWLIY